MNAHDRQRAIVDLVRQRGFLQVGWLADHFAVTPQTIRRDVNELAAKSVLRRHRGGVTAPSSVENVAYHTRQTFMANEKRAIAELAARHVPNEASLFLNIGTTTEAVARALTRHVGLRVITNNLNVANILHQHTQFFVSIAGGAVRSRDGGIVGEATVDFIRQFKVDIGIIGISAIDEDGTLLDFDYQEVRVAQAIIENSRKVYLVADHTKFSRKSMIRLCSLAEIDAFFTDRPPPPEVEDVIASSGCVVHVASDASLLPDDADDVIALEVQD